MSDTDLRNDRHLTMADLLGRIDAGTVDTVIVGFTDMQGRLQGKRLHGRYFADHVVGHGTEGCNYLLAVDVDMNTVDGYAMSSWESGYGDMEFVMDERTLRLLTHLPGTALVGLGAADEHAQTPARDDPHIPQRQPDQLAPPQRRPEAHQQQRRVDGEVDRRAARAVEDAGDARVGSDRLLPRRLAGRVLSGGEADVRGGSAGTWAADDVPLPCGCDGVGLPGVLERDEKDPDGEGRDGAPHPHRAAPPDGRRAR